MCRKRCAQTILLAVRHLPLYSKLMIHRNILKNCFIWTKIAGMIIKRVFPKSNSKSSIPKINNSMKNSRRSSRRLSETCSKSTARKVARVCRESWSGHLRMSSWERGKWTSNLLGIAGWLSSNSNILPHIVAKFPEKHMRGRRLLISSHWTRTWARAAHRSNWKSVRTWSPAARPAALIGGNCCNGEMVRQIYKNQFNE